MAQPLYAAGVMLGHLSRADDSNAKQGRRLGLVGRRHSGYGLSLGKVIVCRAPSKM